MKRLEGALPIRTGLIAAQICEAAIMVCADFPAEIWNRETLTDALSTMRWYPLATDVKEFMWRYAWRTERPIRALELLSSLVPVIPPSEPGPAVSPAAVFENSDMLFSSVRAIPISGTRSGLPIRLPIRTVEEQIAILSGTAPDGQ
jgi:REP element-mobilizing transposase RayT